MKFFKVLTPLQANGRSFVPPNLLNSLKHEKKCSFPKNEQIERKLTIKIHEK